jgi:hypothetical protein
MKKPHSLLDAAFLLYVLMLGVRTCDAIVSFSSALIVLLIEKINLQQRIFIYYTFISSKIAEDFLYCPIPEKDF